MVGSVEISPNGAATIVNPHHPPGTVNEFGNHLPNENPSKPGNPFAPTMS